jgi:hypothetical protein
VAGTTKRAFRGLTAGRTRQSSVLTRAGAFRIWLAVITFGGLVLRIAYVLRAKGNSPPTGDAVYYYGQALTLERGLGFLDPIVYLAFDLKLQAAHHPPLYPVFLGVIAWIGPSSPEALRIASCVAGATAIPLIALVARRVAGGPGRGDRAALIAGGVAAVYPGLWLNDARLLSESIYAPLIALVLLCAYRAWEDPRPREAAFLGLAIGLAALTRAEAMMLFPLLALPILLRGRGIDWRQRLTLSAVTLAVGGAVMAPWVFHNLHRFEEPVTLSYGLAGVLPQANCDLTYEGKFLGYWHPDCSFPDETIGPSAQECLRDRQRCAEIYGSQFSDESEAAKLGQERGLEYMSEHRGRVPVVVAARVGRTWGVFRPGQQVEFDAVGEDRGLWGARAALIGFYEVLALGVYGLVVLRRRGVTILPMVMMAVAVTITAAIAIPITRYRIPLDLALIALTGVAVDDLLRRWRASRRRPPAEAKAGVRA